MKNNMYFCNAMKKRLSVIFGALMLVCASANAQDASYSHDTFSKDGCHVEYSSIRQDKKAFIIVAVDNGGSLGFTDSPEMLLRTGDNEVLKLSGKNLGFREKKGDTYFFGDTFHDTSSQVGMAQFEITEAQIKKLKSGVIKVRLTTTPFIHEKEFKKDKIGEKLYKAFSKKENSDF